VVPKKMPRQSQRLTRKLSGNGVRNRKKKRGGKGALNDFGLGNCIWGAVMGEAALHEVYVGRGR